MLEFTLLGTFDVKRDGCAIDGLQHRRANRLLALLTLESNRRVHRDWIEIVLEMSYEALRQAEFAMRSCLGDDKGRIKVENNSLFLDVKEIQIDIFEFERLVAKGDIASLRECLTLYKGGLLKDWEGGWISEKREEYQESYLDALQTLTETAVKHQEYEKAASYLRRFLHVYPEMDSMWRKLIDVYKLGGNIAQAEEAYENYKMNLLERSDLEGRTLLPSPRVTEALHLLHVLPTPLTMSASVQATLSPSASMPLRFEPAGGAVPLDSPYYVEREGDALARKALQPQTSFVLVKGARQIGKTSLLARLLQQGRERQAHVIRTDWQNIPQSDLGSAEAFLLNVAETLTEQLQLDTNPRDFFLPNRPPTRCFERFLLKAVFPERDGWFVWGIDEADRLFDCSFGDDIFGMLRAWHNERSLEPDCEWHRLTIVLAYATEAYLMRNLNQSPFNVGFPVDLTDFTREQIQDLNLRYGTPLRDERELQWLYALVGGQPFLVRRCLQEMSLREWTMSDVEAQSQTERGFLRDHLERMRLALLRDPDLTATVRAWLREGATPSPEHFTRLCAAGVMAGNSAAEMQARCGLYEHHLRRVL